MNDVDYSNEFVVMFKDGSSENFKLHSFTLLLWTCNKRFDEVVYIKRLPMAEL